ncbi:NADH-quinone oxidoreductase subunit C [Orientia tsutsugamushi]|uniref:NADH-quinone oxidoreductase subunit C n=1 Tax=Orientia tsutsugamushi TaxID=784 RepID=A0A2U3R045_ORITS|nr:NADH-quinone oxidoreductase subunit C [Orientia tsutsugamushi]KJV55981.1 NADH dehydrogenase, subunit C family protein [Orientia tsutsugamushi str. Kato PP]SPR06576.1 NADH-quinone oxidoreductase subunit C [Orientia tsutsugamushi]
MKLHHLKELKELVESQFAISSIRAKFNITNHVEAIINKEQLIEVLKLLKNDKELKFTILTDIFAADFPDRNKRFEIVYNLLSIIKNIRLIVKINLNDNELIQSATPVFSNANWYEREIYDLFGIKFANHPHLKRILTDYGFVGHPLRKDFALSGYSQVKYDDKLEKVVYEPVKLDQEYRNFNFSSPWQGPKSTIQD